MFGLDARMRRFEEKVQVRKLDEVFCECGNQDARRIVWEKLMRPVDPDADPVPWEYVKPPCNLEITGASCNPRPESKTKPVADHRKIIDILLGPDFEDRIIENVAEEAGPDLAAAQQLEILEKIKQIKLEPTGDSVRDAVAARLLKPRELNREELAKKLLVPTEIDQDDFIG